MNRPLESLQKIKFWFQPFSIVKLNFKAKKYIKNAHSHPSGALYRHEMKRIEGESHFYRILGLNNFCPSRPVWPLLFFCGCFNYQISILWEKLGCTSFFYRVHRALESLQKSKFHFKDFSIVKMDFKAKKYIKNAHSHPAELNIGTRWRESKARAISIVYWA